MKKKLLGLLQMFPYILASVVAVEGAVQPGTPGETKASIILNSITAVSAIGEQVPDPMVKEIAGMIDSTVGALNTSGVFTHAASKPAAKPAA